MEPTTEPSRVYNGLPQNEQTVFTKCTFSKRRTNYRRTLVKFKRWPQDEPQDVPRGPRESPRGSEKSPRRPQEAPKPPKMAPGRAKIGPTSPKMAQDSPKMAPRCTQVALRCPSCPEDGSQHRADTAIFPFFAHVPSENAIFESLKALKRNLSGI